MTATNPLFPVHIVEVSFAKTILNHVYAQQITDKDVNKEQTVL